DKLGELLEIELERVLSKHKYPMRLVRRESLFWLSPGFQRPAVRADEIPSNAGDLYANLHRELLSRGYMLAPSAYEIGFISTAHDESHIRGLVDAIDGSLEVLEW
ncbi:MAG: hypothetical protein VXX39_05210, partial [Candidatus Thermoplasmatota archaeon]|nr:hypothetical protein [Candidatus Thermoplasmatota archaeon]